MQRPILDDQVPRVVLGKTSRAEQIASASGVSNMIGLSIFGILAARSRASRAGSLATLTTAEAATLPSNQKSLKCSVAGLPSMARYQRTTFARSGAVPLLLVNRRF